MSADNEAYDFNVIECLWCSVPSTHAYVYYSWILGEYTCQQCADKNIASSQNLR